LQVGSKLSLTEAALGGQVKNLLSKLDANDRTQAVVIGLRGGIIEHLVPSS
jgi:DNA-binding NarL/FixJ family response regulator